MSEKVLVSTKHKSNIDIKRDWYLFDAKDYRLGRLAALIAPILIGKNKTKYSPHLDFGDNVIVVNARKIKVSGRKKEEKKYYRHSGYIGNLKEENLAALLKRKPEDVIIKAVNNMLPKNRLQTNRLKRLHIFTDDKHTFNKVKFKNIK